MITIEDLGFTPIQLTEISRQPGQLVAAWLEAVELKPELKSPAGWVLAGIRSGAAPEGLNDARRRHAIAKAETLIRNIGPNILTEDELVETLFAPNERTADVATLERIEAETRDNPGRALYGPTLEAQLAFTRTHGRQEIPNSGGILRDYDTPDLRARMLRDWQRTRPTAPDADIPF